MAAANSSAEAIQHIPINQIRPDPGNPRSLRDEDLAPLEENLKQTGRLLQPIRVRRDEEGFLVVTGERRFRAATNAGWKTIPAIVDDDSTPDHVLIDQLVENTLRRGMSLRDTARALQLLLEESSIERKELARRLGQAPAWISRMTKLLTMRPSTRACSRAPRPRLRSRSSPSGTRTDCCATPSAPARPSVVAASSRSSKPSANARGRKRAAASSCSPSSPTRSAS